MSARYLNPTWSQWDRLFESVLLDDDGRTPCTPPDDCPACVLFSGQRQGESRRDWLDRLTAELREESINVA